MSISKKKINHLKNIFYLVKSRVLIAGYFDDVFVKFSF